MIAKYAMQYLNMCEEPERCCAHLEIELNLKEKEDVLEDGSCEMIPENPGIRRSVWEHFQNVNRVVQRMKYSGGTFSGYKSTLCAEVITMVGHRCTVDGRMPETDRVGVIERWPACKSVRACSVTRM